METKELISSYENSGSGAHATDREILNELPETNIEDVSKLDSDKKNCVICLEDFKNREKAIILPCIHLFHKNIVQNNYNDSEGNLHFVNLEMSHKNGYRHNKVHISFLYYHFQNIQHCNKIIHLFLQ